MLKIGKIGHFAKIFFLVKFFSKTYRLKNKASGKKSTALDKKYFFVNFINPDTTRTFGFTISLK